ncbi:MAG: YfcE family phosphodiesterase [Phycisphaerae bacterium]|nr:YfcE family phosphodiesterase [Phycisphaerae bacterium]
MLIGILSDSHGRHLTVRRAVGLFDRLGVDLIVHCGDIGDESVLDELAGHPCRFVWGNMDQPGRGVDAYLGSTGIPVPNGNPIEADGKTILIFHGHERAFHKAVSDEAADYILHGHTHQKRDERIGRCRVINPGALHRATPKSVATLDTATDTVVFYDID